MAMFALALLLGVGRSAAVGPAGSYTNVVFADGFESGNLANWNGTLGNGGAAASAAAARTGGFGLRMSNASGQFQVLAKGLPTPLADSSTSFWVRIAAGAGLQQVAQARDGASSAHMWDLMYDGGAQGFYFFPYSGSGSTQIFTGNNSAPAGTWVQVEIQYTATATGGARIYVNGQTQAAWSVAGDYTRAANLQRLQLWNDGLNTTDFDDVTVATPANAPSPPGAPTAVAGTPANASVSLSWAAPASNGGSPITGYRITPYIGATAQTPVSTATAATSATVGGLTNGTAYTFTVAAVNAAGTGLDSAASAPITPRAAATAPGAPTTVVGTPGDRSVGLQWTAPGSDGGSAITGYRIVPFIGSTAQPAIVTASSSPSYTVTGLTNGTAYTFTVAAINSVGTGPASSASAAVTPSLGYSNVVFADGFESGSTVNWTAIPGTGSVSVLGSAAHTGSYGLELGNTAGQFDFVVKALDAPVVDSTTTMWVRVNSGSGLEMIAQARDGSSSAHMWDLYYDWNRQGLVVDTYRATGADEIFTGFASVSPNTWFKVAVQYNASATGGAALFLNGATRPDWIVSGNYARAANLQRIQLWNDAVGTTDFDDVRVATPAPAGSVVPNAPTGVSGASRDSAVALGWSAPTSNGGSAISGYRITPRIVSSGDVLTPIVTDYPVTSYTVPGLTNGTAYTFTVAAINGAGIGPDSTASPSVTPNAAHVPAAPTGLTATPSDGAVALGWTAPADGGSAITGYRVTPYIGGTAQAPVLTGSNATSYTVNGLTNGTAYTFTVSAINVIGRGPESAASAAVSPRPPLSQYTNTIFSDGFESGGLTNWDGSQGTGTTAVVAAAAQAGGLGLRLANLETQYSYIVKALGSPVADSEVSFWVRLGTGTRVATVAQARDGSSSLNMWQLMYDGAHHGLYFYPYRTSGSTEIYTGNNSVAAGTWVQIAVQYTATAQGGARLYINGQTQPGWGVSGDYTRTANLQRLQLWNEGLSANDFDGVAVSTLAPIGASPPGAPTGVTGDPLDHAVSLNWTVPSTDGGSPVTGYQISTYVGGVRQAVSLTGSMATTFKVAGLANGTTYTFTVAALNGAGAGPDSAMSDPITPVAAPPPGQPTGVNAVAGNATVALNWTAPGTDGGSPITGYRVTSYVNGVAQTTVPTGSTATSFNFTGLTNGTAYTFTVAATNSSGTGAESAPSAAVTPNPPTVPGAPTGVTGAPKDSAVALTWTTPANDGRSPLTGYRITSYVNGSVRSTVSTGSTATGFTVNGLTNGTAYTFTVAAINAVGTGSESAMSAAVTPAIPPANPIVLENRQQGTTSWQLDIDQKATNHEIEGYASLTSVNKGGQIQLMVSTSNNAQYVMDIYRMGWYPQGTNPDGTSCAPSCGGRLMQHVGPLSGSRQANCPTVTTQNDPNFGLTECNWTPSYTLNVPTSWTTGNYIVKLRRLDGQQLESYMTFVVRDDASTAPIVYAMDVTTWQAYNYWGGSGNGNTGYDLYGRFNDVTGDVTGSRAYSVSFDRPYQGEAGTDGAGSFFDWDYPMLRWMESKGYDISYVTSVDLESNQALFNNRRVFVNTGHDEYYSDGMRNAITGAIANGVDMAFFSANNFYYRITWAPNASGAANRREHSDKNALPGSTTFEWRLLSPPSPENQIGGVMLQGVANDRPFLISDASSWIYAGTGLKNYTGSGTSGVITSGPNQNALPGIVGYEFDARATTTQSLSPYTSFEPPTTHTVGHSFVPAGDGNATNVFSDAVLYTAPSGATVFSAGTIQWTWGLDDGYNDGYCSCFHTYTNAATQRITANILDRFSNP